MKPIKIIASIATIAALVVASIVLLREHPCTVAPEDPVETTEGLDSTGSPGVVDSTGAP